MRVELYLEDPMGGGCGCSTSIKDRMELVKRIREEAQIWDRVKKSLPGDYTRTVLSTKVSLEKYPEYVINSLNAGENLPFIFVDEALVHSGSYPSFYEFKEMVSARGKQKA
jgi:hypothetical protein